MAQVYGRSKNERMRSAVDLHRQYVPHNVTDNKLSVVHQCSHQFPTNSISTTVSNSHFPDLETKVLNHCGWHRCERQSKWTNPGHLVLEPPYLTAVLFFMVAWASQQCLYLAMSAPMTGDEYLKSYLSVQATRQREDTLKILAF